MNEQKDDGKGMTGCCYYKDEEKNSGYGYCLLVLPHLFGGIVMIDALLCANCSLIKGVGCWV